MEHYEPRFAAAARRMDRERSLPRAANVLLMYFCAQQPDRPERSGDGVTCVSNMRIMPGA